MEIKYFVFIVILSLRVSSSKSEEFLIPDSITPESYLLIITTNVPNAATRFSGVLSLKLLVVEDTNQIYLHSRGHTINSFDLFENFNPISGLLFSRIDENVINFSSEVTLEAGHSYDLLLQYQGNLLLSSNGFFRSDYVERVEGNDVYTRQAATQFKPDSARHAFPCFDTLENQHRAAFEVIINHDSTYHALSNTLSFDKSLQGSRMQTIFYQTPLISPCSLAFFISGFSSIEEESSNGIKLIVSVREREKENTKKLLDIMDSTLKAVESFMGLNLSSLNLKTLHSVVLPNFDKEVESFYAFNYYREDVILFNPLISADIKTFTISKYVTNSIVSQFLGNIVSVDSQSDVWIFNGLITFLEYLINISDFESNEMFISEVLHPTLDSSFSVFNALNVENAEKVACTFRMIYYAIGSEAFSQTLRSFIQINIFKSTNAEEFFKALQQHAELEVSLVDVIAGFVEMETKVILNVHHYEKNVLKVMKEPILLPFNYMTSSMASPSDIKWLNNTNVEEYLIIDSLESDDWFLLNIDQFAFYRVNYNADNWIAIINALRHNSQVFSAVTRAQLIDDAFHMAKENLLPYGIALDLMMELKNETSFLPWNAAIKNLLHLNDILVETDFHGEFQDLMLYLIEGYMTLIGIDELSTDSGMDKFSRIQMIDFICRMKSEDCLNQMQRKLKSHIDDKEKLPVNLESSAFCYGLMASAFSDEGSRLIVELWNELQASDNTEYRLRIINSLGCYGDVKVLFDLLETILASTGEARYYGTESFALIHAVYSTTIQGVEATLNFLIEFQNDAVRRSQKPDLIEVLLHSLPQKIFNERLFDKFNSTMGIFNVSEHQLNEAATIIQKNIAWYESQQEMEIRNWFGKTSEVTLSTEGTTVNTSGNKIRSLSQVLAILCSLIYVFTR
ncbi:CLUMA_CG017671, isoform A [Clunio marinus]|uniref:CLUMA_CG017671, isoform A n=1 Tax=Clunio marinus TaxID=568069 RepID=A0A1J1IWD9_9DIPT|nr:CLUMA_CG017671, isoform A [Clunio marinus]